MIEKSIWGYICKLKRSHDQGEETNQIAMFIYPCKTKPQENLDIPTIPNHLSDNVGTSGILEAKLKKNALFPCSGGECTYLIN